mgnify:CR=1 FL=1
MCLNYWGWIASVGEVHEVDWRHTYALLSHARRFTIAQGALSKQFLSALTVVNVISVILLALNVVYQYTTQWAKSLYYGSFAALLNASALAFAMWGPATAAASFVSIAKVIRVAAVRHTWLGQGDASYYSGSASMSATMFTRPASSEVPRPGVAAGMANGGASRVAHQANGGERELAGSPDAGTAGHRVAREESAVEVALDYWRQSVAIDRFAAMTAESVPYTTLWGGVTITRRTLAVVAWALFSFGVVVVRTTYEVHVSDGAVCM